KMRASQSRQKSYADKRRKDVEFQEGDHVFLKVTSTTGIGRALKSKKSTSRLRWAVSDSEEDWKDGVYDCVTSVVV
ncbi:putative retrotransposon gag protein, partial [Trifolium medium]|nr:putative retrotransposon gag protein [Trifolium medium]